MTELSPETQERLERMVVDKSGHYDRHYLSVEYTELRPLLAIARECAELVKLVREIVVFCPYTKDGRCSYCEEDIEDHSPTCLIGKADALVGKETT